MAGSIMRVQPNDIPTSERRRAINAAAHAAATSPRNERPLPTDAQKEAANFPSGHLRFQGLDITVQYPRGATRSGKDASGKAWSQKMTAHYGHIKGTVAADGQQIDVFIGPNPASDKVFVVDQIDQKTGEYDEAKAMLGYKDEVTAASAYASNFGPGWQVGKVKAMSMAEFKAWLKTGDTAAPLHQPDPPAKALAEDASSGPSLLESAADQASEEATPTDAIEDISSITPERASTIIEGIVSRVAMGIEHQWAQGISTGSKASIDEARASLAKWNSDNPDLVIRIKPQDVARMAATMRP